MNRVEIVIKEARGLQSSKYPGPLNTYVRVKCGEQSFTTTIRENSTQPYWGERHFFNVDSSTLIPHLSFEVWHVPSERSSGDCFLCGTELPLPNIYRNTVTKELRLRMSSRFTGSTDLSIALTGSQEPGGLATEEYVCFRTNDESGRFIVPLSVAGLSPTLRALVNNKQLFSQQSPVLPRQDASENCDTDRGEFSRSNFLLPPNPSYARGGGDSSGHSSGVVGSPSSASGDLNIHGHDDDDDDDDDDDCHPYGNGYAHGHSPHSCSSEKDLSEAPPLVSRQQSSFFEDPELDDDRDYGDDNFDPGFGPAFTSARGSLRRMQNSARSTLTHRGQCTDDGPTREPSKQSNSAPPLGQTVQAPYEASDDILDDVLRSSDY
eukprot:Rmarinus@m.3038